MRAKRVARRRARAKVNLTLHVTGQNERGYHLLDSLVCFADFGDEITVTEADQLSLTVGGPLAEGVPSDGSNLVLKAAKLFGSAQRADIHLEKHLPHAAGIGGGSADAAATMLALAELWGCDLPDTALSLGADVPVCLCPNAVRMRGIGEQLDSLPSLPDIHAVLVNPRVALETPPVFKALIEKNNTAMGDLPPWQNFQEFANWCVEQRNDLQAPAISLQPVIQDVLNALQSARLARMSGSGATCFGLCETAQEARELAERIKQNHPEWWVIATTLH